MAKHHGSCHCRTIRFTADLDLSKGTGRCNCSYCRKSRNWIIMLKPQNVTITKGKTHIATYTGHMGSAYQFCPTCGIRLWTTGHHPQVGDFLNLFVPTLDDIAPDALAAAPVTWIDMANDDWQSAPDRTDHL